MSLRDEIESFAAKDNKMDLHYIGPHRVSRTEHHPPLGDYDKMAKSRSTYGARAVVESFYANLENRAMRVLTDEPVATTRENTPPDMAAPVLAQLKGIDIKRCAVDDRGIVDVVCDSPDFKFDNPVYIVNPPLLVEDPLGTIEMVIGEDELGNPVTKTYREDPVEALAELLADLKGNA